ncbi:hypothetical protein SEA_BILLNYE_47 [Streptomyces phage BillNye]|uniref:Uncharacterized protein n=1 Tax=Streptomyces phage BillNye TaxID=2079426 RepID=A0A2L1IVM9_9CAUD|nr:hypothetical protein FDJ30_gp184 [Streptomyces phage BillNye]AVD99249.1 hypothetical protein SEA_BILLNYE_47 [Streptomyces phage BillNye]
MYCKKCSGRVFVDRVYSDTQRVELFCSICGARWMLDTRKNKFAAWVLKKEKEHALASVVVV